jgi:hypothetical protein
MSKPFIARYTGKKVTYLDIGTIQPDTSFAPEFLVIGTGKIGKAPLENAISGQPKKKDTGFKEGEKRAGQTFLETMIFC